MMPHMKSEPLHDCIWPLAEIERRDLDVCF